MSNFGMRVDGTGISRGIGTNAKMPESTAAVALAALDAWDRAPWLALDGWYRQHLPASVVAQRRPAGVYSLMPVKLPISAELVKGWMEHAGVQTKRWYYPPMHRHPLFSHRGNRKERRQNKFDLPITDDLAEHLLGLPWHLGLTEQDVIEVCTKLAEIVDRKGAA
jgi:dTDP-4-amino-4,6-dideoxygalactose transaminase